jgi:ribosomal protein L7/L12
MPEPISDDDAERVNALIFTGRKIEAIKIYRKLSGKDLKDWGESRGQNF